MGPKQNVACEWFETVWNKHDSRAIHRLATPDMVSHGPDGSHRRMSSHRPGSHVGPPTDTEVPWQPV